MAFYIDPFVFERATQRGEQLNRRAEEAARAEADWLREQEKSNYDFQKQQQLDIYGVPEKQLSSQLNFEEKRGELETLQTERTIKSAVENLVDQQGNKVTLNAADPRSVDYIRQAAAQLEARGQSGAANALLTRELPAFALSAANATPDAANKAAILQQGGLIPGDVQITRNAQGNYDIRQGNTVMGSNVSGLIVEDWLTKAVDKVSKGFAHSVLAGQTKQTKADMSLSAYDLNVQRAELLKEQQAKLAAETERRQRINNLTVGAVETLNNPNATPAEKKQAYDTLSAVRSMTQAERGVQPKPTSGGLEALLNRPAVQLTMPPEPIEE